MGKSIEFKLFAPYNKGAALVGSFSNWQEIPMQKDEKGYFRALVDLEDGVYEYKFRVQTLSPGYNRDEWLEIVDPYATRVGDGGQTGIVQIKEGEAIVDTYVWQHDANWLPPNHELVLYEMHVSDFCGAEDPPRRSEKFKRVAEKLDYLCELGINAIQLMPVTEYPGEYRWGFKVRYFFAPETSYGPSEDLKLLIDECHARGIRVFIDGTYNHTDEECPLMFIDRGYWYYQGPHYPDEPVNYWGPEFNYEHYDARLNIRPAWEFIGDAVNFWIKEYHIDGIRFDAVRQLGNREFLHWIAQQAREAAGSKPFYLIAEHIPETPTIVGWDAPFEGCWHESFSIFVVDALCDREFNLENLKKGLDPKRDKFWAATNLVNYLGNHDRERVMAQLGDCGVFDEDAFRRAKLGAVIMMTAVGVPMIWMGDEFGFYTHKKPVTEPNPLEWKLLKNSRNSDLFYYFQGLIALRKQNHALYTNNIEFFHENAECKVLAYVRWNDRGDRVVVVANFSNRYLGNYGVPNFPAGERWHEWTYNYDVEARDCWLITDLPPYEAKVFVWQ